MTVTEVILHIVDETITQREERRRKIVLAAMKSKSIYHSHVINLRYLLVLKDAFHHRTWSNSLSCDLILFNTTLCLSVSTIRLACMTHT